MKLTVIDQLSTPPGGVFSLLSRYEQRVTSIQEAIRVAREGIWKGAPVMQVDPELSDTVLEIRDALRACVDAGVRYRVIDVWHPSPK